MAEKPIRILLVDDDEDDYILTRDLLREAGGSRFDLKWVDTYERAVEVIQRKEHDLYLFDYRLGERNGIDLLRFVLSRKIRAPRILLTAQGDHEVDMKALALGASDYLDKQTLSAELLERSIRYALERNRAEEALKKSEQELIRTKKFESLTILAGGIAHDYNNLLSGIIGYMDLALMKMDSGQKAYDSLRKAHKSAMDAKDLTRRFLHISKGSSPFFIAGSIERMIRECETECAQKFNSSYEMEISDVWPLEFDYDQMKTVITSLFINACESMPGGGVLKIDIRNVDLERENTTFDLEPGRYVKITVEDRGAGIPKENLTKVFDPYFSTKEMGSQKGMGLGLTTAYAIVKNHKGGMGIESEVGIGTTVTIFLPAIQKEELQGNYPMEKGEIL